MKSRNVLIHFDDFMVFTQKIETKTKKHTKAGKKVHAHACKLV